MGYLAGVLLKALENGRIEDRLVYLEAVVSGKNKAEAQEFEFISAKEPPQ
jgi:hypothetical protein